MKSSILTIATLLFAVTATAAETHAKISMEKARSIALKKVPGGEIQSAELENEHGRLIYSFDIKNKSGITEVNVNAKNGKVVDVHRESPAKEAAEKKKEASEKH